MPDRLEDYRRKRDPDRTPEPFGAVRQAGGGAHLFVVQHHAARNLHFDFRLELGGTLRSWAVPKGPSADPSERRMAVEVEDHPVEYADFEGVIPAGNYGAGEVILWDRGWWRPIEDDPEEALSRGKLTFELSGYKLRGEWALVRTRGSRQWLLLKHRDAHADPGGTRPYPPQSILSGRTVEEVATGVARAAEALGRVDALGAPRARVASSAGQMLAEQAAAPFDDPAWLFELKYDGYRVLAEKAGREATLRLRGGGDATARFPEVARAVAALPVEEALLDGELVVLDAAGRPDFQALQGRAQRSRPRDVDEGALVQPATLFAFDLLAAAGRDLRPLPLLERKACLAALAPRLGPLRYADHVEGAGAALFKEAVARGLEGVVAKRADATYAAGRSRAWLKVRGARTADLAVVGFTAPARGRTGFGALEVAARGEDGLTYAGRVGSGFDEAALRALHARLSARARATPAFGGAVPRGGKSTWVEPELVVEVRFAAWTREGLLRQPVFLRVRDDKGLDAVDRAAGPRAAPAPAPVPEPEPPREAPAVTRPEKVFFPRDGITKGELVGYYRAVAPVLLPHLRDRPLTLTRFPDGIDGKSFFQKDAPPGRPAWIRTVTVHSDESARDLDLLLIDDADGLAWVANQGTIPLHVGAARAPALERPDWLVVDLDPKEAPFADVVRLAQAFHRLLDDLGLPSFPKTSGQAGLHVLVPTGGLLTHDQARLLASLLCQVVERRHGDLATTTRTIAGRGGRVYLDALQNGRGKTIAAAYCVRPKDGAPVSTPLAWGEVTARLAPGRHTIRTVLRRLDRLGGDPLAPLYAARAELLPALERLHAAVGEGVTAGAQAAPPPQARPQNGSRSRGRRPSDGPGGIEGGRREGLPLPRRRDGL